MLRSQIWGTALVAIVLSACPSGSGLRQSQRGNTATGPQATPDIPVPELEPEDKRCKYDIKDLKLGQPCNIDTDCSSGLCGYHQIPQPPLFGIFPMPPQIITMCTTSCASVANATCATGFECKMDYKQRRICVPDTLPDPNTLNLKDRSPCNVDEECSGGKCIFTPGGSIGYCSSQCTSDAQCGGGCMQCRPLQTYDDATETLACGGYCQPNGGRKVGEECVGTDAFECESGASCVNRQCVKMSCYLPLDKPIACSNAMECPNYGDACVNNKCSASCTDKSQCINGFECNGGKCDAPGVCFQGDCPQGSKCGGVYVNTQDGPHYQGACFAADRFGTVSNGDTCKFDFECKDQARCVYVDNGSAQKQVCATECTSDAQCGNGASCASFGSVSYCVPSSSLGTRADGEFCTSHLECAGRNCAQVADKTVCATKCDSPSDCGSGLTCAAMEGRDGVPYLLVAVLKELPRAGGAYEGIDISDSATYDVLAFDRAAQPAGTQGAALYLRAKLPSNASHVQLLVMDEPQAGVAQAGSYVIAIQNDKAAAAVAMQAVSENASNNDVTPTQTFTPPFKLTATLAPNGNQGDVDFFNIAAQNDDFLTARVSGPRSSVCYNAAKVGSSTMGQACEADYQCVAGLHCNVDTYKCTKHCTQTSDCGSGFACAGVGGMRECLVATTVATKTPGQYCSPELSYECAAAPQECLSYSGDFPFCSATCTTNAQCPSTMKCADVDDTSGVKRRCVNKTVTDFKAGASCDANFQCQSGKCSTRTVFIFQWNECECNPASTTDCAADEACTNIGSSGTENRCYPKAQLNLPAGADCEGNFNCTSGTCDENTATCQ